MPKCVAEISSILKNGCFLFLKKKAKGMHSYVERVKLSSIYIYIKNLL